MTNNIKKVFNRATMDQLRYGMSWYPYASMVASNMANTYDITKEQACGVISALSPNNKWERNLKDAWAIIEAYFKGDPWQVKVCTYNTNKGKAIRILKGEPIDQVLKGQKTWSFYNNILDPGSPFVTIDFHANDIFHMSKNSPSLTKKRYKDISQAYIDTAHELGIRPTELQAVTWVVWRNSSKEILNENTQTKQAKQEVQEAVFS